MRGAPYIALTLVLSVLMAGLASPHVAAKGNEARVELRIHVPVVLQLSILEPVNISLPRTNHQSHEPLLMQDVGKLVVASNTRWALTVQTRHCHETPLHVKPNGAGPDMWADLGSGPAVYTGTPGSHLFSWDVKVGPSAWETNSNEQLELLFTLTQL